MVPCHSTEEQRWGLQQQTTVAFRQKAVKKKKCCRLLPMPMRTGNEGAHVRLLGIDEVGGACEGGRRCSDAQLLLLLRRQVLLLLQELDLLRGSLLLLLLLTAEELLRTKEKRQAKSV